ncbi:hypothetical protein DICPUDRAFT_87803 [Dictyostelium purpureum]|uniref:DUF4536 domain-containing protein n=1 Tax=Dictyostelium purpureum TaxID=5786 RepID=F0ZKH4_DICPU|nr:uncharacterized protein DICPUDRAFT_87803 [Dictyostelium purpureum]EGC35543.1 hypothetical protein DICPUDRAFT_87803 [Dictyostelium purpureum]|eukprot:XP_003287914.1 hypothetical protein DICPUDRAFT_87803 [Dictyostelium purpureum]
MDPNNENNENNNNIIFGLHNNSINNNNNVNNVKKNDDERILFIFKKKGPTDFSKECTTCHRFSGTIIGASGIYSFYLTKKYPENKRWLSFVGFTTLSFGLYWGWIDRYVNPENYID